MLLYDLYQNILAFYLEACSNLHNLEVEICFDYC